MLKCLVGYRLRKSVFALIRDQKLEAGFFDILIRKSYINVYNLII